MARHLAAHERVCLSLDFRGEQFQGPPAVLAEPDGWPRRVIVMTLARVGSGAGPEIDRLLAVRAAAPDRAVYAAGGVRDAADLAALQHAGDHRRAGRNFATRWPFMRRRYCAVATLER